MSTSVSRRSSAPVHPTRQQLEELDALLKRMLELPVNPLEEAAEAEEAAPPTATVRSEGPPAVTPPEPMRGPHRPALTQTAETTAPAVNYQTPDAEEADLHPRVVAAAPAAVRQETIPAAPPQPTAENPTAAAGDWIPLTSSWRPSARTWKPLSEAWRQAQTGTGAPPVAPPWVRDVSPTMPPEPEPAPLPPPAPPRVEAPAPTPKSNPVEAPAPPDKSAPPRLSPRALRRARHWKPTTPSTQRRTPWFVWPLVGFNAVFDACLLPWGPLGRWLRGPTGRAFLGILGLLFLTAAAAWAAAEWIGWTL